MKRFLNCNREDFLAMSSRELLQSIKDSEGRILISECIASMPNIYQPSYPELARAMGADMILLNIFDVEEPFIQGIGEGEDVIRKLKQYCGCPVGLNLEPTDLVGDEWKVTSGRQANAKNALKAKEMGFDFICLTGNPGNLVNNKNITSALKEIREAIGDALILIAGKMHASGIDSEGNENIISLNDIKEFVEKGADIILLPAVGTVPGVDLNYVKERVRYIHQLNALALSAIGTSQEGSDEDTIKDIALLAKQSGVDIHHIGDSGLNGMAIPENIFNYSKVIRGKRHTYSRMANRR